MANGFVVASSPDTASAPTAYWNGTNFGEEIDGAEFYDAISVARGRAGELQSLNTNQHVEAYSATLTIAHSAPLDTDGI